MLLHTACYCCSLLPVRTESHPAFLYIRAGNVHFQSRYAGKRKHFRTFPVFFYGLAHHIGNKGNGKFLYLRQDVVPEIRNTGIFQTDAVQHAGNGFRNTDTVISLPWCGSQPFPGNGTDLIHINVFGKLQSVADRTGCTDDRIFHGHAEIIH